MKKNIAKILLTTSLLSISVNVLQGCDFFNKDSNATESVKEEKTVEIPKIENLEFEQSLNIEKANYLNIDKYKGGYYVITSHKDDNIQQMLVVPEGQTIPEGLDDGIIVVTQPVNTSKIDPITMVDLLSRINSGLIDKVSLVTVNSERIANEKLRSNMEKGLTQYAGKEKTPDIDLISKINPQIYLCGTGLVKEKEQYDKIKQNGMNPFVVYFHLEEDILGRIEWVKALGVIFSDYNGAETFYDQQKSILESVDPNIEEKPSFVMFCLNKQNKIVYIKRTDDVACQIGYLAGGRNAMSDIHKTGFEEMSVDNFLERFKDTDYLIYLYDHGGSLINTKQDIIADFPGFNDLKAVKDNNLWKTKTDYLQMNNVGDLVRELNGIFSKNSEKEKEFIRM